MSQYSASSSPPVTAAPLMAPITGLVIDGQRGEMSGSADCPPSSLRSSPAQNTGSAPVRMTTSTSSSDSASARAPKNRFRSAPTARCAMRPVQGQGPHPLVGLDQQDVVAHALTVTTPREQTSPLDTPIGKGFLCRSAPWRCRRRAPIVVAMCRNITEFRGLQPAGDGRRDRGRGPSIRPQGQRHHPPPVYQRPTPTRSKPPSPRSPRPRPDCWAPCRRGASRPRPSRRCAAPRSSPG